MRSGCGRSSEHRTWRDDGERRGTGRGRAVSGGVFVGPILYEVKRRKRKEVRVVTMRFGALVPVRFWTNRAPVSARQAPVR